MLHFLPPVILGSVTLLLMVLNTILWSIPFHVLALAKFILPLPSWRRRCLGGLLWLIDGWGATNNIIFWLTQKTEWDIQGVDGLNPNGWYLVSSNHQSWLDIPVLFRVFQRRIPLLRFFLKQELMWVPIIGSVGWALELPFMKRYSREFLKKHPELRGKDLETTRKACERFKKTPVSILNFLEGTRFTAEKYARQESPYRHLLRPKAGGIAFVLGAMGEQFDAMLDVTIIYPNSRASFWEFLSGRMSRIIVRVKRMPIPQEFLSGDYMNDTVFRERFQAWVRKLWSEKDALIEQVLREAHEDRHGVGRI